MRDDSDESLMRRYQEGEVRAFEGLVERYRRRIFYFALQYVRIPARAEDITQDTFLRVVRSAGTYRGEARFTNWLHAIARNLCIDELRMAKGRRATSLDASISHDNDRTRMEVTAAVGHAIDRQAIGGQLKAQMEQAIDALPPEQREIFLLREVSDLQFNEIAEIVGANENTVKTRMRLALAKLREALVEYRDLAEAVR